MMALVDYRGFRLIAMSVLPVQGDSLIYGSKDAGMTVKKSDPVFNGLMKEAGERLNLAPHLCGMDPEELKELWSACDIEGHLGVDGLSLFFFFVSDKNLPSHRFQCRKFLSFGFQPNNATCDPSKRLTTRPFVSSF